MSAFTELSVMNKIRKNKLSKAIYLMQKTLLIFEKDATCSSLQNYLTVTVYTIPYFSPDLKPLVKMNDLLLFSKNNVLPLTLDYELSDFPCLVLSLWSEIVLNRKINVYLLPWTLLKWEILLLQGGPYIGNQIKSEGFKMR